jgi:hypothetical protein
MAAVRGACCAWIGWGELDRVTARVCPVASGQPARKSTGVSVAVGPSADGLAPG